MDRDGVRRVMASLQEELLACFEGRHAIEPMPDGHLEVVFTIMPSGIVGMATVTQSLRQDVDGCVEELVRGQMFPKPTGGKVRVGPYRIVFERVSKNGGGASTDGRSERSHSPDGHGASAHHSRSTASRGRFSSVCWALVHPMTGVRQSMAV